MTQTIQTGGENGMVMTQKVETVEFSKAALEDGLFDIPAGYTQANSSGDLYGMPDYSSMIQTGKGQVDELEMPKPAKVKRPGVIRIGILPPTNKTAESVSAGDLQRFLAGRLTTGNYEGIAVSGEADARAAGCDYLVSSDISKMKQSTASKIGGIFGKVTSTDTSGSRNFDAQVDYRLVSLKSGQQVLQNRAAAKFDGTADRAAENVMKMEASAILAGAK
jgi:hypothetical protein